MGDSLARLSINYLVYIPFPIRTDLDATATSVFAKRQSLPRRSGTIPPKRDSRSACAVISDGRKQWQIQLVLGVQRRGRHWVGWREQCGARVDF